MKEANQYAINTALVKAGVKSNEHHGVVGFPLYKNSTVLYDSIASLESSQLDSLRIGLPNYGRFGSPSVRNFEDALSLIEGGFKSICTSSGLSAITTAIQAFVAKGDHILISESVYAPTRNFCNSLLDFGIEVEYYSPEIGEGIEGLIKKNTQIVYMESPGSLSFEVQDVPAIARVCKEKGVYSLIDNTWATPVYFNPIKVGVDVVLHSATKYIMGHSDGLLGAIVCANEKIYNLVRKRSILNGQNASEESANLALRGLKTLSIRLEKHQSQAIDLASWLKSRKEVKGVLFPALEGDKGYELWKRDFTGAAGIFTIILDDKFAKPQIDNMLDGMKVFGLGFGWGGFESLIVPIENPNESRGHDAFESGSYIRINVGLEDFSDLQQDLTTGLESLTK